MMVGGYVAVLTEEGQVLVFALDQGLSEPSALDHGLSGPSALECWGEALCVRGLSAEGEPAFRVYLPPSTEPLELTAPCSMVGGRAYSFEGKEVKSGDKTWSLPSPTLCHGPWGEGLAVGCEGGEVVVLTPPSGKVQHLYTHYGPVTAVRAGRETLLTYSAKDKALHWYRGVEFQGRVLCPGVGATALGLSEGLGMAGLREGAVTRLISLASGDLLGEVRGCLTEWGVVEIAGGQVLLSGS
jgi:hypothetical protein